MFVACHRLTCRLLGVPDSDVGVFASWAGTLSPVFNVMTPEQTYRGNRRDHAIAGLRRRPHNATTPGSWSRSHQRALSTCLRCNGNSALGGSGAVEVRGSGGFRRPGDVVPGGEAVGHLGAIVIGGEPMAAGPEMRGDHAEHRQEPLGCAGGAEAFHGAFALPGRLVRVLRPVEFSTDVKVLRRKRWAVHAGCGTGDALERVATPVLARSFRSLRRGCLWGVTLRRAARTSGGTV